MDNVIEFPKQKTAPPLDVVALEECPLVSLAADFAADRLSGKPSEIMRQIGALAALSLTENELAEHQRV